MIPDPRPDDEIIGSHAVTLLGYDDFTRTIKFENSSWGREWGEEGIGTLSYDHYEERAVEAWIQALGSSTWPFVEKATRFLGQHVPQAPDVREIVWEVRDILQGQSVHVSELYDLGNDERIGWAFAVPRDGFLDVEELFVPPHLPPTRVCDKTRGARQQDIGVPESSDQALGFLRGLQRGESSRTRGHFNKLGLTLRNSPCRWAAYVALSGVPSAESLNPLVIPDRPAMNRGAWKAAILASSIAVGSAVQDASRDDRKQHSLGEPSSRHLVNSSTPQDVHEEQAEDDLLPGVEYDVVLTAPPRESVSCTGIIVSISEGRTDLPVTDSDWAGMMIDEDED